MSRASGASFTISRRLCTTTTRARWHAGELALEPEHHFARPEQLAVGPATCSRIHSSSARANPCSFRFGDTQGLRQAILAHHGEEGALTPLITRLTDWRDRGLATVIACHTTGQAERLKRLLLDRNLNVRLHPEPFAAFADVTRLNRVAD